MSRQSRERETKSLCPAAILLSLSMSIESRRAKEWDGGEGPGARSLGAKTALVQLARTETLYYVCKGDNASGI